MTADEKRCVSFFLHHTISSLTSYYDSPLWNKLVLQMCCEDAAVFHAVVALSAVNQDLEKQGLPASGVVATSSWRRYALEQSMRSFELLSKRRTAHDPQLRQVVLVCCLLFVILELGCGHFDDATAHLQNGLAILKEMKVQRKIVGISGGSLLSGSSVESSLLEAFLQLESQATHFGAIQPPLYIDHQLVHEQRYEAYLFEFRNLQDVWQAFNPLANNTYPFLEQCSGKSEAEVAANYGLLQARQQRLLSCLHQFGSQLTQYLQSFYHRLTQKERRGADIIQLFHQTAVLTVKTCLYTSSRPKPASVVAEYEDLLCKALAIIDKFPERPFMTVDSSINPTLYAIAARCPEYSIRLRAIDALRRWPHSEGYLHSIVIADFVVENMKLELRRIWHQVQSTVSVLPPRVFFEEREKGHPIAHISDISGNYHWILPLEPDRNVAEALLAIRSVRDWTCIRASGILPPKSTANAQSPLSFS